TDAPGARRQRAGHRHPGRQVAVLQKVVLGEPAKVEAELVEPGHLLDDRGVEAGVVHPRARGIAEVVDDAEPERRAAHATAARLRRRPPPVCPWRSPCWRRTRRGAGRSPPATSARCWRSRASSPGCRSSAAAIARWCAAPAPIPAPRARAPACDPAT